jgi:hypothetical protein
MAGATFMAGAAVAENRRCPAKLLKAAGLLYGGEHVVGMGTEIEPAEHDEPLRAVGLDDVQFEHGDLAAEPAVPHDPQPMHPRPWPAPYPEQPAHRHPGVVDGEPGPRYRAEQGRRTEEDGRDGAEETAGRIVGQHYGHHGDRGCKPASDHHGRRWRPPERHLSTGVVHSGDE